MYESKLRRIGSRCVFFFRGAHYVTDAIHRGRLTGRGDADVENRNNDFCKVDVLVVTRLLFVAWYKKH